MRLDCGLAENEGGGYLGVGEAAGDQPQHVELALGQLGELRRPTGSGRCSLDEALDHPPGDRGSEQRLAVLGYVTGKLFKRGKPFGRYTGVCAQLNGGNQQCTFVLGLPDGQIVTAAGYGPAMNVGNTGHEAIVGGTGAYEGVRGQGDDRETGNGGQLHLHLIH